MTGSRGRTWIFILIWLAALLAALLVDPHVARWVADTHPINKHSWLVRVVRLPGNYVFLIVIALGLVLLHPRTWHVAAPLLLSGPVVGIAYVTLKWVFGRRRPVIVIEPYSLHPFIHGIVGLFKSVSGLSFPSGDATMAFAAAGCLTAVLPRWKGLFLFTAFLVAVERVLENAHYVSDVVAGAGLGWACAILALAISRRFFGEDQRPGFPVTFPPRRENTAKNPPPPDDVRTCAGKS